jgi:hypothetical protein
MVSRTLSQAELEERLEEIIRLQGVAALNQIRDDARTVSKSLKLSAEYQGLNKIIGTLLGTKNTKLKSLTGKARQAESPYDSARLELFQTLHAELCKIAPIIRNVTESSSGSTLPFSKRIFRIL